MPIDLAGIYETVMAGLGTVPSALIAAALLAGPTAVWLITRFVNPPDIGTTEEVLVEELLWVCPHCRSINEDRIGSCYRCHKLRSDESVPLVIETTPTRPDPGVGIAVGPGVPQVAPDRSWIELEVARASDSVDDTDDTDDADDGSDAFEPEDALEPEEDQLVAELPSLTFAPVILEPEEDQLSAELPPLTFEPVILEPRVRASGRPGAAEPAGRRTRRKPPDNGESTSKRARKTGSG